MTDQNEPRDPSTPQNADTPKKGGFGAFAEQYRERWAAGHPNARRPGGRDEATKPAPGTSAPTTPRAADGEDDTGETPGA